MFMAEDKTNVFHIVTPVYNAADYIDETILSVVTQAGDFSIRYHETTAANVHDIIMASRLIREDDEVVYGDAGYIGLEKRDEVTRSAHLSSIDYRINRKISSLQKVPDSFIN